MKAVIDHRYAKHPQTEICADVAGTTLGYISAGAWIGVLAYRPGWYKVITAEFDGWVKQRDTMDGEDMKLSIIPPKMNNGKVIHYALSA